MEGETMKTSLRYKIAQLLHTLRRSPDPKESPDVRKMLSTIKKLENGQIKFKVTFYKNNEWSAESINLPGIITAGDSRENIGAMIEDAVFTYFNIPPRCCEAIIRNRKELTIKESKAKQTTYVYRYPSTRAACGA